MFYVYIVASQCNGTIYTGHTDELMQRVEEHKSGVFEGFSKQHNCIYLVWFESHETRESAFRRERQMKEWDRAWKIRRIEDLNPDWLDLSETLTLDDLYGDHRKYPSDRHLRLSGPRPAPG